MTKKQMRQFANEIYQCELAMQNPDSSKQERNMAEARILSITNQVMSEKYGVAILTDIDEIVQQKLTNLT